MYTIPTQFLSEDSTQRCFVKFTYEGKLYRLYNGNALAIDCFPNRKKSDLDKKRELQRLLKATYEALQAGWHPGKKSVEEPKESVPTLLESVQFIQTDFHLRGWSSTYLRDMLRVANELCVFLNVNKLDQLTVEQISSEQLTKFLATYRSSARYYMNKRRNLSALFALLVKQQTNPVTFTLAMKTNEVLNQAYTPEQLTKVLYHLQENHINLHLCALLVYGTLLRPHREIRLLKRQNFDAELNHILLAGSATKSKRIRRVPVPDYVKTLLINRGVKQMAPSDYIFTGTSKPLNADYFTTAWSRQKRIMLKAKLIFNEQTLYSFRHSAAVYSFTNRQNLQLLQGLMGHSTPDVTLKYLRSLGIIDVNKEDLPRLPCL